MSSTTLSTATVAYAQYVPRVRASEHAALGATTETAAPIVARPVAAVGARAAAQTVACAIHAPPDMHVNARQPLRMM